MFCIFRIKVPINWKRYHKEFDIASNLYFVMFDIYTISFLFPKNLVQHVCICICYQKWNSHVQQLKCMNGIYVHSHAVSRIGKACNNRVRLKLYRKQILREKGLFNGNSLKERELFFPFFISRQIKAQLRRATSVKMARLLALRPPTTSTTMKKRQKIIAAKSFFIEVDRSLMSCGFNFPKTVSEDI